MLRDEICSMTNYMVEQNIWWDEFFGGTSRAEGGISSQKSGIFKKRKITLHVFYLFLSLRIRESSFASKQM